MSLPPFLAMFSNPIASMTFHYQIILFFFLFLHSIYYSGTFFALVSLIVAMDKDLIAKEDSQDPKW